MLTGLSPKTWQKGPFSNFLLLLKLSIQEKNEEKASLLWDAAHWLQMHVQQLIEESKIHMLVAYLSPASP